MGHGAETWGDRTGHEVVAQLSPMPPELSPKGWYLMMPLMLAQRKD